jgi:glycosyltransferase involved in cell wall biosynthesis
VSIGIPTYNRASMLKRSIESALNQDYENVEVVVSDNASTDQTESICSYYCDMDSRLKYFRQSKNRGALDNFSEVLKHSSGQFFMWLGDDDWVDKGYVSAGVQQLVDDPAMSLVSGTSQYYRNGKKSYAGKTFDLLSTSWWKRIIAYYAQVADNGMFYGVMRTTQIRQIEIPRTMGGDWVMIAGLVSIGKAKVIPGVTVHRELGGATGSYRKIADSLGLSNFQAIFPMLSIASSAWVDIMAKGDVYKSRPVLSRFLVAGIVFFLIPLNQTIKYARAILKHTIRFLRRLVIRSV